MSDQPFNAAFEDRVIRAAKLMAYPPTPNLAKSVTAQLRAPRPAYRLRPAAAAALAVLIIAATLFAVPSVRAAVIEFIQIGVVRIFTGPQTPTPTPTPGSSQTSRPILPTVTTLPDLLQLQGLDGEMTIEEAEGRFGQPLKLPAYPEGIGEPDRAYYQLIAKGVVILIWLDPADSNKVALSLHYLTDDTLVYKGDPRVIDVTKVNGLTAYWLQGPYAMMIMTDHGRSMEMARLIDGNVLVWFEPETGITYRLESGLPIDEAVKIAESLK